MTEKKRKKRSPAKEKVRMKIEKNTFEDKRKLLSKKDYLDFVGEALFENCKSKHFTVRKIEAIYDLAFMKASLDSRYSNLQPPSKRTQGNYLREFYNSLEKEKIISANNKRKNKATTTTTTDKAPKMNVELLTKELIYKYVSEKLNFAFKNYFVGFQYPSLNKFHYDLIEHFKSDGEKLLKGLEFIEILKQLIMPQITIHTKSGYESEIADYIEIWFYAISNDKKDYFIPAINVGRRCVQLFFSSWDDLNMFAYAHLCEFNIEIFEIMEEQYNYFNDKIMSVIYSKEQQPAK